MDAHKSSAQFARIEVVETGRRRSWSAAEKQRIVEESCAGHGQVAATARRYGLSRALLTIWRKKFGVSLGPPPRREASTLIALNDTAASRPVEIILPNGFRLSVSPDIEPRYLRQIVKALI